MKSKLLLASAALSILASLSGCNTVTVQSAVEAAASDFMKHNSWNQSFSFY